MIGLSEEEQKIFDAVFSLTILIIKFEESKDEELKILGEYIHILLNEYTKIRKQLQNKLKFENQYISIETLRKLNENTDTYRDFTEEVLKLL